MLAYCYHVTPYIALVGLVTKESRLVEDNKGKWESVT